MSSAAWAGFTLGWPEWIVEDLKGLHQLTHLCILPYTPRRPLCQRDRLHMLTWYTHHMDISNHTHTHVVSWAALQHRV